MHFHRTPQFWEDFQNLTDGEKNAVTESFPFVSEALQGNTDYYSRYRIKKMEGHSDIWEGHVRINLCFTFHYEYTDNGEKVCFFRRVGTHEIYQHP